MRLPGYDYSTPGFYFVTLVTEHRENLFGSVNEGEMNLSEYGVMVARNWTTLPYRYHTIRLDEFVVMPNHLHGIIEIRNTSGGLDRAVPAMVPLHDDGPLPVGVGFTSIEKPTPTGNDHIDAHSTSVRKRRGLPEIIRGFKTSSATSINDLRGSTGARVWQRNYYDRIIKDEIDLERTRQYIRNNPKNWTADSNNP